MNAIKDFQDAMETQWDALSWASLGVEPSSQVFKATDKVPFIGRSGNEIEWFRMRIDVQSIAQTTVGMSPRYDYFLNVTVEIFTPQTATRAREWELFDVMRKFLNKTPTSVSLVRIETRTDMPDSVNELVATYLKNGR